MTVIGLQRPDAHFYQYDAHCTACSWHHQAFTYHEIRQAITYHKESGICADTVM